MVKKIHYIWLGRNKKSRRIEKCLRSWRKFFPDWEIIEWNEDNVDVDCIPYCRQAYDSKKYAFVSDYLRNQILYQYGGLYFDTDVEVIRSMNDILGQYDIVMGFENPWYVGPGLISFASKPGLEFYKTIADTYLNDSFLKSDGSYNTFTICQRVTPILKEMGFSIEDKLQIIDRMALFPHEYFCPTDYVWSRQDFTQNTRTIHHYDASWKKLGDRAKQNTKKAIYRIFKPRLVKSVLQKLRNLRIR